MTRLLSAAAVALALAVPASVHAAEPSAADRETARALMKEGDRFLKDNDAAQALRAYSAAHHIMNVPPTGMAVVRALTQLGRLVEARDVALQVIRAPVQGKEPAVWVRAREDATAAARSLEPRIAGLVVNVEGGRVEIDGVTMADGTVGLVRKVDPGNHVVVVSAPGRKEAKLEVSLAEGEKRELTIELEPVPEQVPPPVRSSTQSPARSAPTSPPSPRPSRAVPEPPASGQLLLIGGASVAALGVAVGAITGYLAIERSSDLRSSCPSSGCPPSRQGDYDSAHRLATVSNVAFAVGLVGIGVGAYGYYLSSSTDRPSKTTGTSKAEVWPVAGLGVAGLGGRF